MISQFSNMPRFKALVFLIIFALLSLGTISTIAIGQEIAKEEVEKTSNKAAQKITIGFLSTHTPLYENELQFSDSFNEIINSFGATMQIIDYNEIYRKVYLERPKQDILGVMDSRFKEKHSAELKVALVQELENNLKKHNIKKVFIPGNYYNFDNPPYAPLPNRQAVTAALLTLSKQGKVQIFGICGGLQGILYADGIKITNLVKMGFDKDQLISFPGPHAKNVKLNKIMLNPASHLGKLAKDVPDIERTENGWMVLYLPDFHSEAVDLSKGNLAQMNQLGYKIVGFSTDGIVKIIEDNRGDIYFQPHPEGLVLYRKQPNNYNSKAVQASIELMSKLFSDFIQN